MNSVRIRRTTPSLSHSLYPLTMPRRSSPEALFVARRMGLAGRLVADGMLEHVAERWIKAWEADARARGFDARTPVFWDGAPAWIGEHARRT